MDILLIWVIFMLVFMALTYLLGARAAAAAKKTSQSIHRLAVTR